MAVAQRHDNQPTMRALRGESLRHPSVEIKLFQLSPFTIKTMHLPAKQKNEVLLVTLRFFLLCWQINFHFQQYICLLSDLHR